MPENGFQLITVEKEEGIAWVTVRRPEVRNAINSQVMAEISVALDELQDDEDAHLLIFIGAGHEAFVAGADISEIARRSPADALDARMQRLYDRIASFPQPTIAAVNGYAFGGGHELALSCDIRIATTNALFAFPETGLGIMPAAGGTQRLAEVVGIGRATELILTGRRIPADEALAWGLVSQVVEPEQLKKAALDCARSILSRGPLALQLSKTVVQHGFSSDAGTARLLERLAQAVLYGAEEKAEGTRAFIEKRAPNFRRGPKL
ncbi:enoyl-CoA hydratase/isomerase family protein [Nesterenkonia populi]|uniref:enoyl-CoA hydratase/isomerase family protein n=1 Tax=Nesterenkonia populi TaxID=1591087 RepID=UPI0011BE8C30|nr:enoyl-CoA hydratase-related protein [Nesterenkonia populi]